MMNNKELTIRIIKNTGFCELYRRFLIDDMKTSDYGKMLSLAIIFINCGEPVVKRLGYRIITIYSNRTGDILPLYEESINSGLYPISKRIEETLDPDNKTSFFMEFNSALIESFLKDGKYLTWQQNELFNFYNNYIDESVSVVAPTSYGKTDLIVDTVKKMRGKRVCILTPTKALLAQTKRRIQSERNSARVNIITHPDMYKENSSGYVAVLTQERLMTLLRKDKNACFDCVVVDEAHEIFDKGNRGEILARDIIILNKRNENTIFKFLSPFIANNENLDINYAKGIVRKPYKIDEYIKTEKVYVYDVNKKEQKIYDQFINEFISSKNENIGLSDLEYIKNNSTGKNIIYFNKPKDIEAFVKIMIEELPDINVSEGLRHAIEDISNYINPEYTLVKSLKKGIVYHHASVPDSIRSYIEYLYTNFSEIKYIVTSSTLLEGVNIPATRLFVMNKKRGSHDMTASEFRNLSGRICRFSEIFSGNTGNLSLLEPEIHIVFGKYFNKNADIENYIKKIMKADKKIKDKIENPLMCNVDKTVSEERMAEADEVLENFEHGTINGYSRRFVSTKVGKACIGNNITEIDIFRQEGALAERIEKITSKITTIEGIMDCFNNVFLDLINTKEDNIMRLKDEKTRAFYKMFLKLKYEKIPFKLMISKFVAYWQYLRDSERMSPLVFVGKWGDEKRGGHKELWTDISKKSISELINLAIVRIKEEMDFVDNTFMKYVEVLNELELLDENLYMQLKYNTTNTKEMAFIINGYSLELAELIMGSYNNFLEIDEYNYTISIRRGIVDEMQTNNENAVLINEARNLIIEDKI